MSTIVQLTIRSSGLSSTPLPPAPPPVSSCGSAFAPEILAAHTAWVKGSKEIAGLMLMTMEPEIQRNLENLHANDMLKELKALFAAPASRAELLRPTTRIITPGKQKKGKSEFFIVYRKEFDGLCQNYNSIAWGRLITSLQCYAKAPEQTP
ncbi:hypothetical protein Tco_0932293 [Tanacetum coccineum]